MVIDDGTPAPTTAPGLRRRGRVGRGRLRGRPGLGLARAGLRTPVPGRLYVLYTGGTTGMPKGVIWRQEDIFFAAMGGGGWGAPTHRRRPTSWPSGIDHRRAAEIVMLVVAPLMHGNAQWVMWNAFMMGGTAVLYTEHRYDPDQLWRLVDRGRGRGVGGPGRRRHGPAAGRGAGPRRPGPTTPRRWPSCRSGGAMLSATVKGELQERLPDIMVMDRFGSSESGAQGAVEDGATGPRFAMSERHLGARRRLEPAEPGDGRIGRLARTGRIPLGYYKDKAKTEATFPVDARRRAVVDPRRSGHRSSPTGPSPSTGGARRRSTPEARRSSPRRSRRRSRPTRGLRRHRGRAPRRAVRRAGGRGRPARDPDAALTLEELQDHCRNQSPATRFPASCWWWTRFP